jgi:hypothetical protein
LDGSTVLATVDVNQELAPNDFTDAGVWWEDLGGPYNLTGTTLVVRLSDDANEFVIADAVRIVRVGDLQESLTVSIAVNYLDSAGEGFFDATLGAARQTAFEFALGIWSNLIVANFAGETITVDAQMDPLPGDATGAVLGSATVNFIHRDYGGSALPGTWYVDALANHLNDSDLNPSADIIVTFNSDVDNQIVLGATDWYYGTDANPGAHIDIVTVEVDGATIAPSPNDTASLAIAISDVNGGLDLFSAVNHELGHVLGFGHDVMSPTLGVGVRQLASSTFHTGRDADDGAGSVGSLGMSARFDSFFSLLGDGGLSDPFGTTPFRSRWADATDTTNHRDRLFEALASHGSLPAGFVGLRMRNSNAVDADLNGNDEESSRLGDMLSAEDLDTLFANFPESLEDEIFWGMTSPE